MKITVPNWLTVDPYVYVHVIDNKGILYNTLDGKYIETESPDIIRILHDCENSLRVVPIDDRSLLENAELRCFIDSLRDLFMGDLIPAKDKPVQFIPRLNLQDNIERLKKQNRMGKNITMYLQEVFFNLDEDKAISPFVSFINQLPHVSVLHFQKGAGVLKNDQLQAVLADHQATKIIDLSYSDFDAETLSIIPEEKYNLKFHVNFPVDIVQWQAAWDILSNNERLFEIIFKITSEEDYKNAEQLITRYDMENYQLEPVYAGNNLSFFENNVYLTKEDIFTSPLSMREIFAHQALNTSDFGKITVMPNGDVHANVNHPPLGNIATHTIHEMLYREMDEGKSWLRIRDQAPCNKCLYQWLCPSPSDYEIAIGRSNLCHVKQSD